MNKDEARQLKFTVLFSTGLSVFIVGLTFFAEVFSRNWYVKLTVSSIYMIIGSIMLILSGRVINNAT